MQPHEPPRFVFYDEAARSMAVTEMGRKAAQAVYMDSNHRSSVGMLNLVGPSSSRGYRPAPERALPRLCVQIIDIFVKEICDAALCAIRGICESPPQY
jgi:hypothetical protein